MASLKKEEERKVLATIEKISHVSKHPNADRLVLIRVLGYEMCVSPSAFDVDMECFEELKDMKGVMFYPDAIIPKELEDHENFAYLTKTNTVDGSVKRVKTIKIRGVYSQGLMLPLSAVQKMLPIASAQKMSNMAPSLDEKTSSSMSACVSSIDLSTLPIGTDVTDLLRLKKYYAVDDLEGPSASSNNNSNNNNDGKSLKCGVWPAMIPKTDQPHMQKQVHLLRGSTSDQTSSAREWVATMKVDGQSATFFYDPKTKEAGVCSRNMQMIRETMDHENKIVRHVNEACPPQFKVIENAYSILSQLRKRNEPLAIQGEIYGQKINGNRLQMPYVHFAVFDIYRWTEDTDANMDGKTLDPEGSYLPHRQVVQICQELGLPMVPVVMEPTTKLTSDVSLELEYWMKQAEELTYDALSAKKGLPAEGIVLKSSDGLQPYVSCKVISRKYLVKYDC